MLGEPEAIVCCPPAASDDAADRSRSRIFAFGATASTVVIDVGAAQCWITVTCDQSVLMRASFLNSLGDPITGDWPIWQFSYQQFFVNGDRFVKFKGLGTAGNVWIYVSNR
jgi:hypothetical protein